MCGIAGFYGFRNDNLLKQFSRELEHRGPDGEGMYIDETVSLLNRRLAIIDVEGGNQPIYNEDRTVAVTYNGEIYNYQELRKTLESKGHKFTTQSDTEVIVHGYEEWGEMCFDRFNGMFGIALYDKNKKRLILARDHFGIKPLYYSLLSNSHVKFGMLFSSEIKPIINSGFVKKIPNDRIIYRYLHDRVHDDTDETFFHGIYRLLPGELMTITESAFEKKKYSNLEEELTRLSHQQNLHIVGANTVSVFKEKLTESVRLRLVSEVSVGTCLSGGLDSSSIVALVNELLKTHVAESKSIGSKQKTFSAVFPGSSNDEERYIDNLVKQKRKIEGYRITPKPEEFFSELSDFIHTQEEPTISTGPYAQYKVMQMAHDHVTVVLDGQGSDEMMAGYDPYYFVYLNQLWSQKKYAQYIKESWSSRDIIWKYLKQKIFVGLGIKKQVDIIKFMNINFASKHEAVTFSVESGNLKRRLLQDIFRNSLQSLLRYEDKNAMRFSIEGRVPFLDFNLLKYLFSLDDSFIIRDGWNKFILRQSMVPLLPKSIAKRRNKIGFTTPEYEWFMHMKNKIYGIFLSESFANRPYFNQKEVLKAFQMFIEGRIDDTMVFWRCLNLELWLREFIDNPVKKLKGSNVKRLDYSSNEGKKLAIDVEGERYLRFPIKTDVFKKGDNYARLIAQNVTRFVEALLKEGKYIELKNKKFYVVVSEKIVAISQGRSYFIWDIKPSILAEVLSKYVTRTPYGIGLGSPWTMQLAINEVGSAKIILATFVSAVGKMVGIKGLFYKITGETVRSIDGPTEYSLYPSNVSAKLGPKNPKEAAMKITEEISRLRKNNPRLRNFLGSAIIDANDLGQNVLGNSTELPNRLIEKIFKDNPMGQADEQTPLVIVYKN